MSVKIFPNAFRKLLKVYSDVKACSDVEERRFSAALSAVNDAGFSPRGRISLRSRLSLQPLSPNVRKSLAGTPAAVALLALAASSLSVAQAQKPASVTADLPAGPMQSKATTACLECHEARIILQQRLSKAAWTKEVDKMTKWGAVVDPADRDALIDYLSANFSPDKPAYEPPRTSAKNGKLPK
jgi:mono/diheme cytochrome c family protein